jgi:hypothetical protein
MILLALKERYVAAPNWCNYFPRRFVVAIEFPRSARDKERILPTSRL